MNLHAGILFQSAVAWSQAFSESTEGIVARRQSLASILFATISTEAFINEIEFMACVHEDNSVAPGWLRALSDLLGEAEDSHASVVSKYQLAKFILSGQPFDKGVLPFQDFKLLVEIRNRIAHGKSEEAVVQKDESGNFVWTDPKIMLRLQNINLVDLDADFLTLAAETHKVDRFVTGVFDEISTQTTAIWACKSAAGIVNGILDAVPNDFAPFKNALEVAYRHAFTI